MDKRLFFYGKEPSIKDASFLDFPSKDGLCLTIFFSGCVHNCNGCHNADLKEPRKNTEKIEFELFLSKVEKILKRLKTNKLVLQGGDPLHPMNKLVTKLMINYFYAKEYEICVYTGYEFDEIEYYVETAKYVKTGVFKEEEFSEPVKTDYYIQFASKNQKLYVNKEIQSIQGRYYFG